MIESVKSECRRWIRRSLYTRPSCGYPGNRHDMWHPGWRTPGPTAQGHSNSSTLWSDSSYLENTMKWEMRFFIFDKNTPPNNFLSIQHWIEIPNVPIYYLVKIQPKTHSNWRGTFQYLNKATRSPDISREQVQKLTPQFCYIYIGYRFPVSLSTIWGNHLPVNFMLKFPTCISTIWRNHLPHLTSKWRGTFQYFQSHDKMPYIYYLAKPPPFNQ